jgi:hypothetical protein
MKKHQLDHILRAAGNITGQKQFVIVGSQALHGKYPDLADEIVMSAEADLFASRQPDATELLNEMGVDSPFYVTYGFYADSVDEGTAVLAKVGRAAWSTCRPAIRAPSGACAWSRTIWPSPSMSRPATRTGSSLGNSPVVALSTAGSCWPWSSRRRYRPESRSESELTSRATSLLLEKK